MNTWRTKSAVWGQRGMTLLEVMVALLIFALTGTAIIKATTDHLNNVAQLEEITFATWVANNQLNTLKLSDKWPPQKRQRGQEVMSDRQWFWQIDIAETNDSALRAATVSVGLDPRHENFVTSVTTFVAEPSSGSRSGGIR